MQDTLLYKILEKKIHSYCDKNMSVEGEGVLFYAFLSYLNSEGVSVSKKVRNLTEKIVGKLIKRKVLEESKQPEEFNTPFGYYKKLKSLN